MEHGLKYGLSDNVITSLCEVFKKYPLIEEVILYGSRAKGTYHNGSDIDLAVFSKEMGDNIFSQLWNDIDMLPIIYKIDVLHFDKLQNEELKNNIQKSNVVFYKPFDYY